MLTSKLVTENLLAGETPEYCVVSVWNVPKMRLCTSRNYKGHVFAVVTAVGRGMITTMVLPKKIRIEQIIAIRNMSPIKRNL